MSEMIDDAGHVGPPVALPRGASDLLPADCRRRRVMTERILQTFETWGYEPVATPAIEYFDVLARGLSEADRRGCVRFIAAGSGELVTLRADVTPQIARLLAQRWGGELPEGVVHRLCYAAEVLRQPTAERAQSEVHQVGIELVGDGDPAADAELVALADASLRAVGLIDYRLDLAHVKVARGLLAALSLSPSRQQQVEAHLRRKDRDGLASVLASSDAARRRAVVALSDLFGPPRDVLARAEASLCEAKAEADSGVGAALAELSAVVEHLERWGDGVLDRVTIDLGEARGFDYYSGLRVRGWARGVRHPVVAGGRYDGMPRRYGVAQPATGFAVDLAALDAAMAAQGLALGGATPPSAHLVALAPGLGGDVATRAQAQLLARQSQRDGMRAWVQPEVSLERARQVADDAGAERLSFFDNEGCSRWSRGETGWTEISDAPTKEMT